MESFGATSTSGERSSFQKTFAKSVTCIVISLGAAAIEDRLEDVSKLEKSRKANFQLLSYIFVSFKSYLCPVSKIS